MAASFDTWPQGGDPSSLRRFNVHAVMRTLHGGGAQTITELARTAQISRPTAKQAIDYLVQAGWVTPAGGSTQGLGRPAQSYAFRPDAGHVLGADIGGSKVLVIVADLSGKVVARSRHDLSPTLSPGDRLNALALAIEEATARVPDGARAISHAVISTPGTVDADGTIVFNTAMPDWLGRNPAKFVGSRFPSMEVAAADDMAMSALAEHWVGAAVDVDNIVYLHLGTRAGTAALVGGRPHVGHHRAAPQVGMWRATPWRDNYRDLLRLPGSPPGTSAGSALFAAAAGGDPEAVSRINIYADEIVAGIIPFVIAFDPQMLVVGGGVSKAGEAIVEPVRQRIMRETQFPPVVVGSPLGEDAVALGAVRTALDSAEERLYRDLSLRPA